MKAYLTFFLLVPILLIYLSIIPTVVYNYDKAIETKRISADMLDLKQHIIWNCKDIFYKQTKDLALEDMEVEEIIEKEQEIRLMIIQRIEQIEQEEPYLEDIKINIKEINPSIVENKITIKIEFIVEQPIEIRETLEKNIYLDEQD